MSPLLSRRSFIWSATLTLGAPLLPAIGEPFVLRVESFETTFGVKEDLSYMWVATVARLNDGRQVWALARKCLPEICDTNEMRAMWAHQLQAIISRDIKVQLRKHRVES